MGSEVLELAILFVIVISGVVIWKIYDDNKRDLKGLSKLPRGSARSVHD